MSSQPRSGKRSHSNRRGLAPGHWFSATKSEVEKDKSVASVHSIGKDTLVPSGSVVNTIYSSTDSPRITPATEGMKKTTNGTGSTRMTRYGSRFSK